MSVRTPRPLPHELALLKTAMIDFGAPHLRDRYAFDQTLAELRVKLGAHWATLRILEAAEQIGPAYQAYLKARTTRDRSVMLIARAEGRQAIARLFRGLA